jgi:hypothetical protein
MIVTGARPRSRSRYCLKSSNICSCGVNPTGSFWTMAPASRSTTSNRFNAGWSLANGQRCCQPQFTWSHKWHVGDLVVWDNRCIMHRRDAFDPNARRIMHRAQRSGDRPVNCAEAAERGPHPRGQAFLNGRVVQVRSPRKSHRRCRAGFASECRGPEKMRIGEVAARYRGSRADTHSRHFELTISAPATSQNENCWFSDRCYFG